MIIPSQHASRVARAAAGGGGGGDVTPNAVDWPDASSPGLTATSTAQTITGINTSINLYWECDYCGDGLTTEYNKNGAGWVSNSEFDNISISNNDTLNWRATSSGGFQSIFIKNASDSNALLDTISFEVMVG
jgi:hypothetical protein